ncbi:transcriptional regulator, AbrB family [Sulfolobus islandicus L.S.2.15]|uniref:Transcriptional regulator, AbrB family n=2 Tax=Saccharolobus islandicus TaxID=43080 RepID=C3MKK2_SACI2|nr:AbrB/MazE/SpoVT family DNA-binding domain-containing protein [Sulfolobus islandicus]ACP36373.1 transcriptional regulator, AbrB family [Sulfolobus islandicus L.S.2.15]ADB88142.1 transcriptional regulator, AbrB family [Sulfolobus islandicus L.D.8.5]
MYRIIRIGKRNAIYIPKEIANSLNLKEGDRLVIVVEDGKIELIPVRKPSKYWAEISPEEVEEVGEEISGSLGINS